MMDGFFGGGERVGPFACKETWSPHPRKRAIRRGERGEPTLRGLVRKAQAPTSHPSPEAVSMSLSWGLGLQGACMWSAVLFVCKEGQK